MGINLALTRISKLLQILGNPHASTYKSIHIAGTNGKGSTVTYISSILTRAQIRNGTFTSPHLLYYNDCISINNETYPFTKFKRISDHVKQENETHGIGCTQFELLTVTAFKIFEAEKVEYAVIEVGLGGRLDATNVLPAFKQGSGGVIVCGITKIGIDHESFLGNTFAQIASEKAGIIKDNILVVVDKTNNEEVLHTIEEKAKETDSKLYLVDGSDNDIFDVRSLLEVSPLKGSYQLQNLSVAVKIIEILKEKFLPTLDYQTVKEGIQSVVWPGRLQTVQYKGTDILIDGAHNESAAQELKTYLDAYREDKGLIFVVASSKGKSIESLLKNITNKEKDSLIASKFSPPDGMPWVSSYDVEPIQLVAKKFCKEVIPSSNDQSIKEILDQVLQLRSKQDTRKVVVCGSLYLCSDVLRLVDS